MSSNKKNMKKQTWLIIPHGRFLVAAIIAALLMPLCGQAKNVVWFDGTHPITYNIPKKVEPVVAQALSMFCDDMRQVTGMMPVEKGKRKEERGKWKEERGKRKEE